MIFDIVVIAAILLSCVIAVLRGFIREVLTILGVVGGAFAALSLGPSLVPKISEWLGIVENPEEPQNLFGMIPYPIVADAIAYGTVFIIVVIILSVISHFLSGWAKSAGLGIFDRILGVVFGVARASLLLGLLYMPFHILVEEEVLVEWFGDSKTRPHVEVASAWMSDFIPKTASTDMTQNVETAAEAIKGIASEEMQKNIEKKF